MASQFRRRAAVFLFVAWISKLRADVIGIRIVEGTESIFGSDKTSKTNPPKVLEASRPPRQIVSGDTIAMLPLVGHCFTFKVAKYNYTVCPFDNITQNDVNNRNNRFVLGMWGHWEGTNQVYTDGCMCGNISRQTIVNVTCGAQDFFIGNITEPNTCDYRMNFQVPIPCAEFEQSPHFKDHFLKHGQAAAAAASFTRKKTSFLSVGSKLAEGVGKSWNGLKTKVSDVCKRKPSRRELEEKIESLTKEIEKLKSKKK